MNKTTLQLDMTGMIIKGERSAAIEADVQRLHESVKAPVSANLYEEVTKFAEVASEAGYLVELDAELLSYLFLAAASGGRAIEV